MTAEPLVDRLRREADLWADDEEARSLLLEAAARLEAIAAEVTRLLAERSPK